jgi:hypothetical protein
MFVRTGEAVLTGQYIEQYTGWTAKQSESRFPERVWDFLRNVQTESGTQLASYLMGTTNYLFGDKTALTWSWRLTSI